MSIKQLLRFPWIFSAGLTNLRLIWLCHFRDILILKTATFTNGDKCISKKSHHSNLNIGYSDIVKLNHILVLGEDILKKQSQVYFTLIEKKWNSEYGSIYINLELWNLGCKFQQFIFKNDVGFRNWQPIT